MFENWTDIPVEITGDKNESERMAYAEKPLKDMGREVGVNEEEKKQYDELADKRSDREREIIEKEKAANAFHEVIPTRDGPLKIRWRRTSSELSDYVIEFHNGWSRISREEGVARAVAELIKMYARQGLSQEEILEKINPIAKQLPYDHNRPDLRFYGKTLQSIEPKEKGN